MTSPGAPPPPSTPTAADRTLDRALPVLGTPARTMVDTSCAVDDDGCITCGDVAVALTVTEVGEYDARCRDDTGRTELVATELVGPLSVGDRLLVHARVALEVLTASGDPHARATTAADPPAGSERRRPDGTEEDHALR